MDLELPCLQDHFLPRQCVVLLCGSPLFCVDVARMIGNSRPATFFARATDVASWSPDSPRNPSINSLSAVQLC